MWDAIAYVTSGFTLAAFLAAVAAWVYRIALLRQERLIQTAEESDRANLVAQALEFFPIETKKLPPEKQFELALEQIRAKASRFRTTAIVVTVVALLAASVALYAIYRGQMSAKQPERTLQELEDDLENTRVQRAVEDTRRKSLEDQLVELRRQQVWEEEDQKRLRARLETAIPAETRTQQDLIRDLDDKIKQLETERANPNLPQSRRADVEGELGARLRDKRVANDNLTALGQEKAHREIEFRVKYEQWQRTTTTINQKAQELGDAQERVRLLDAELTAIRTKLAEAGR